MFASPLKWALIKHHHLNMFVFVKFHPYYWYFILWISNDTVVISKSVTNSIEKRTKILETFVKGLQDFMEIVVISPFYFSQIFFNLLYPFERKKMKKIQVLTQNILKMLIAFWKMSYLSDFLIIFFYAFSEFVYRFSSFVT